ncbi:peptidoglycan D,D-transpeptidase FtsI family protein [Desulfosporosinus nitroreducens]|uniref:Penicillin-binding transpeptidase domain-containing protein n=1 Tax=Desulfosporosinus nitroreducens TaxID=2018668 RepID=A0ABT8QK21_9FIRM|nr:penicillin-binding transpeptidase domain-containing protein [Desulfosporosinus nitroreducens]MCO1601160.1 penicillin-binding transpeptidase domain-containing protein [Desulfosporosinus nitroreducens]MDO0821664.1 penicillin-binding transpeptidase domain-containing protein [Desulfosporosinus nitroreducens]
MRGVRQVALGMAFSFFILSLGLVYWQVVRADTLLQNPANRRLILMESRVTRGGIFDRNGEIIAQTQILNGKKVRVYPKGEMFEPALGYSSVKLGASGLEANLADWLLGIKNATPTQAVQQLFALPRQGDDVVLTLDSRLQSIAYDALKGKMGAAVALDPRTGEVLAMVSQPSFNPTNLDQHWNEIISQEEKRPLAEKQRPLEHRYFSLFPPGSTMKVVTSAALFRSGINTTDLYQCQGSTIINGQVIREQNDKAHGWVNYNMALAESCNTYFATFGVQAGDQTFLSVVKGFGFGQKIPFELSLPRSSITQEAKNPSSLNTNLLAASTFGQGEVLVSPFHMALMTAGIANHGVIMTPHLVERVLDPSQDILFQQKPQPWLTALSKEEADKITSAMVTAVTEGTAAPGALPNVQVAGKTGSAEPGGNVPTHAWYIAFAPAEEPQIAVAVIVENGGTGGGNAAPIARQIIQEALNQKVGDKK